jgi:hypothetical protein
MTNIAAVKVRVFPHLEVWGKDVAKTFYSCQSIYVKEKNLLD